MNAFMAYITTAPDGYTVVTPGEAGNCSYGSADMAYGSGILVPAAFILIPNTLNIAVGANESIIRVTYNENIATYIFTSNQAAIDHTQIANIGINTHNEIDTHIADTSNPHKVSSTQVGASDPLWNANKLQNISISSASPTSGQYLAYTAGSWQPVNLNQIFTETTSANIYDDTDPWKTDESILFNSYTYTNRRTWGIKETAVGSSIVIDMPNTVDIQNDPSMNDSSILGTAVLAGYPSGISNYTQLYVGAAAAVGQYASASGLPAQAKSSGATVFGNVIATTSTGTLTRGTVQCSAWREFSGFGTNGLPLYDNAFDLDQVRIGSLVDTYKSTDTSIMDNEGYSGIVVGVNKTTGTITVDQWHKRGTAATGIPTANSLCVINGNHAIWGQNTNVFLFRSSYSKAAVAHEYGLWNKKPDRTANGTTPIEEVSETSKYTLGVHVINKGTNASTGALLAGHYMCATGVRVTGIFKIGMEVEGGPVRFVGSMYQSIASGSVGFRLNAYGSERWSPEFGFADDSDSTTAFSSIYGQHANFLYFARPSTDHRTMFHVDKNGITKAQKIHIFNQESNLGLTVRGPVAGATPKYTFGTLNIYEVDGVLMDVYGTKADAHGSVAATYLEMSMRSIINASGYLENLLSIASNTDNLALDIARLWNVGSIKMQQRQLIGPPITVIPPYIDFTISNYDFDYRIIYNTDRQPTGASSNYIENAFAIWSEIGRRSRYPATATDAGIDDPYPFVIKYNEVAKAHRTGLGTADPQARLDINGDVIIRGSLTMTGSSTSGGIVIPIYSYTGGINPVPLPSNPLLGQTVIIELNNIVSYSYKLYTYTGQGWKYVALM
jgi:hypothetical protein